jgi:hypothetical protein
MNENMRGLLFLAGFWNRMDERQHFEWAIGAVIQMVCFNACQRLVPLPFPTA